MERMHICIYEKKCKMTSALYCFLVFAVVCGAFSAHLPSTFKKCKRTDLECLRSATENAIKDLKNGNKELGIHAIDPLEIPEIHAPGSGTTVKIDQKYINLKLHGLSDTKITSLNLDIDKKCELKADAYTPVLSSTGDYDFRGQLILIPINSQGFHNTTLSKMKSTVVMSCEKFEKKGKSYLKITDFKMTLSPEHVNFFYDKVFDSNSEIATQISQVLNENSLLIFNDAKPDWEKAFGLVFQGIANQIFSKVPTDEIFIN